MSEHRLICSKQFLCAKIFKSIFLFHLEWPNESAVGTFVLSFWHRSDYILFVIKPCTMQWHKKNWSVFTENPFNHRHLTVLYDFTTSSTCLKGIFAAGRQIISRLQSLLLNQLNIWPSPNSSPVLNVLDNYWPTTAIIRLTVIPDLQ